MIRLTKKKAAAENRQEDEQPGTGCEANLAEFAREAEWSEPDHEADRRSATRSHMR